MTNENATPTGGRQNPDDTSASPDEEFVAHETVVVGEDGIAREVTVIEEVPADNVTVEDAAPADPIAAEEIVVEDADTYDATSTPVEVETVHATATEPVIPTTDPAATSSQPIPASERVVYVQVPPEPKMRGNRGFGVLLALAATLVYTAVLALVTALVGVATTGGSSFRFLAEAEFYIPSLFFVIAFVILVLLANRANWWAYILGSLVVALVVYFGTIGLGLLGTGIVTNTPDEAEARFTAQLLNPFVIVAAVLAREVSMWTGTAISRRGRSVKVRNAEARAAYDRELAEKRAAGDRSASATAGA